MIKRKKSQWANRFTSRRQFLYGCGSSLVIPPLISLMSKNAYADVKSASKVKRLVLCMESFGMRSVDFLPDLSAATLDPMPGHPEYSQKDLSTFGNNISYFVNSNWKDLFPQLSMFQHLGLMTPWGHTSTIYSGGAGSRTSTMGRTIDSIIEQSTVFKSSFQGSKATVRLHAGSSHNNLYFFHDRAVDVQTGQLLAGSAAHNQNPGDPVDSDLFDQLFNSNKVPTINTRENRKKLLVDKIYNDYKSLKNHRRISSQDKATLDKMITGIFEVQKNLQDGPTNNSCSTPVGLALEGRDSRNRAIINDTYRQNCFKMVALAFMCDQTRIFCSPFSGQHHSADDQVNLQYGTKPQKDRFEQFIVPFARELMSTQDPFGNGTILDNSLIIWANEHRERSHKHSNIPILTLGNLGGDINPGKLYNYFVPGRGARGIPLKRLLSAVLHSFGLTQAEIDKNGDDMGFGAWVRNHSKGQNSSMHFPTSASNHTQPLPGWFS